MGHLKSNRDRRLIWLIGLALAFGTLACYWPVRHFNFVNYDDPAYVYENPHVITLTGKLSLTNAGWAFRTSCMGNWHPLTMLSHMADVQLFGLEPGAGAGGTI